MDETERARLMDEYDAVYGIAAICCGPEADRRQAITSRIIDGSDNPDVMRIWMQGYRVQSNLTAYHPEPDRLEIKAAIRARIITGQYGDAYRITIHPPKRDRFERMGMFYVDAPPSETLRDAIIAYDELHGTDLLTIHEETHYRKVCRHGTGTEDAVPATPDLIRDWVEIMDAGNDPFEQYHCSYGIKRPDPHIPKPDWTMEADG